MGAHLGNPQNCQMFPNVDSEWVSCTLMRNPVAISGINFFFCRLMGIAPAVVPRENCPGIGWSIKDEQGVVSGVGQHSFE